MAEVITATTTNNINTTNANNDNIFMLKTVQSVAFKTLMEALKELLTDTCIEFDEQGMKIITVDQARIVLVHMRLHADKFEYYHCPNKVVIGVNILNLQKCIRTINSNDTLTLYMDKNDLNHLGICIENGERNSKTNYKLNLMDLDKETIRYLKDLLLYDTFHYYIL